MNEKILLESKKLSKIIAKEILAKQIYLFGSYAYGAPNDDSDIDLYVVADLSNQKKIEATQKAQRSLLGKTKMPIDIIVSDIDNFNERKAVISTLEYVVANDGVLIYGQ